MDKTMARTANRAVMQYKASNDANIANFVSLWKTRFVLSFLRLETAPGGGHCQTESFVENRCVG